MIAYKQQLKYIITGLIILFLLWGCDKSDFGEPNYFMADIQLTDSKYALYVNHEKYGEFIIDDQEVLKKNKDFVFLAGNLVRFLRWDKMGYRYGFILFKNGQEVKRKLMIDLIAFELRDMPAYGKPAKSKSFRGNKTEVIHKIEEISKNKDAYLMRIYYRPHPSDVKEFNVTIRMSSMIIQDIFSNQKEEKRWQKNWEKKLRSRLQVLAPNLDFSFGVTWQKKRINLSFEDLYIELYGSMYNYEIYLRGTEEVIEQLQKLDFSSLISDEERGYNKYIEALKHEVSQSNRPELSVENAEVRPLFYRHKIKVGEIKESHYFIEWIELIKKNEE